MYCVAVAVCTPAVQWLIFFSLPSTILYHQLLKITFVIFEYCTPLSWSSKSVRHITSTSKFNKFNLSSHLTDISVELILFLSDEKNTNPTMAKIMKLVISTSTIRPKRELYSFLLLHLHPVTSFDDAPLSTKGIAMTEFKLWMLHFVRMHRLLYEKNHPFYNSFCIDHT